MISEIFVRTGVNAAGVSAVALARTFLASEAEKWKGGCVHPIGLTAVMEEENELVCTVCGCACTTLPIARFATWVLSSIAGSRLWLASGCLGAPPERLSQEHVQASGVMTNAAPFQSRGNAGQAALGRVAKGRGRRRDEAYAVLLRACGRMALPAQVKDNAVRAPSRKQSTTCTRSHDTATKLPLCPRMHVFGCTCGAVT